MDNFRQKQGKGGYNQLLKQKFFFLFVVSFSITYFYLVLFIPAPSSFPQNVSIMLLSPTSLFISWSPPPLDTQNGIITEYRVNITELETGNEISFISFTTSISVQFLHPYYTYFCIVSAVTIAEGPPSEAVVITTPEDGTNVASFRS